VYQIGTPKFLTILKVVEKFEHGGYEYEWMYDEHNFRAGMPDIDCWCLMRTERYDDIEREIQKDLDKSRAYRNGKKYLKNFKEEQVVNLDVKAVFVARDENGTLKWFNKYPNMHIENESGTYHAHEEDREGIDYGSLPKKAFQEITYESGPQVVLLKK
jgi:hypothetical protein